MDEKKVLVPMIIAIMTMVFLVMGATYAYFTVTATKHSETRTITATLADYGNVALQTKNSISINLTGADMVDKGSDVTYYASTNGKTTTASSAIIATATVEGTGTFKCDYTLKVDDNSSNMYDKFQSMSTKSTGQIVLSVNGTAYDFNTSSLFPKTISGIFTGLTSSSSQNITAQLKIVNKTGVDQSALAGSNLTLTFTVTSFDCTVTA